MLFNLRHKLFFGLSQIMEPLSGRQLMQQNKQLLDNLIKRRFVFFQGFQIYRGCAGLYDFGPVGCAIKTNIQQLWRQHFVLEQDMLQISTTCITPHKVLQKSGHVAKFTDLMVKDVKTGAGYRADKLLSEWIQAKLEKGKLKANQVQKFKQILVHIDSLTKEELDKIFQQNKIKSPDTGNALSKAQPFNLMFKTQIGPSSNLVGYLRPETAQGMFVNFNKLVQFNGGRIPFAAAQIGLGFRNQIAPRNGLIRVRQFQMAEIQHFVDPLNKNHPKFKYIKDIKLPLYSKAHQKNMQPHQWMEIGVAVEKGIVDNQTLGYFMTRIFLYLKEVGLNVEKHVRFRQHLDKQMAHYATDCWDAEAQLASGWLQIVGCADRSAFDLSHHTQGSGVKLHASRRFKQPRPEQQTTITINRQIIGKQFKKQSTSITEYLQKLTQQQKANLKTKFQSDGKIEINLENVVCLGKEHIEFQQKIVQVMEQKYIPSVIQPSFGLGRVMTAMFEHCFRARDKIRTYLLLKPRIAPVKVSILPLQNDQRFVPIIADLKTKLKKSLISCKVDDTGHSIGKRYARTDEIGIPFGITVDFQTLQEHSVTLRELFTMKQLRVPLNNICNVLAALSQQTQTWEQVCKRYPAFTSEHPQ